ncbi:MAG: hypothetical protein K5856_05605 [Bacteroidaceae bacterium]|nr:hypothetical protein [Bacteroidaceae bacterium]
MNQLQRIGIWLCLLWGICCHQLQAQQNFYQRTVDVDAGLTYSESFFIISNYSCINGYSRETASVADLLSHQVEGFYFYLQQDARGNRVMLRQPDGSFVPLQPALEDIKHSLENNLFQIVTLFLDYEAPLDLADVFAKAGLAGLIYERWNDDSWPSLKDMIDQNKRLVVFEVQKHMGDTPWLHSMDEYVAHTDPDWGNAHGGVELPGEKSRKSLSLFTGFKNVEALQLRGGNLYETARFTPYLVNLVKDTWSHEGRLPNFIVVDTYGYWVENTVRNLREFNLVYGTLTSNDELVNYVSWEGMNNATPGIYCFPLENGVELMLSPVVPGYRVQPVKMYAMGDQKRIMMPAFKATPVGIDEQMELFMPFNEGVNDLSLRKQPVMSSGVDIQFEMTRGQTANFDGQSRINLPTSRDLQLRDHDFTVQVWLKIPKFVEGKADYCVLGSKSSAYQQALHLLIRNGKPYMGFYNNDIQGNTTIEPNKWYHVIWRYNKQNGEQAIFVNGKVDAIATGRPGYMGSDSLYVGYTGFNLASYFVGALDNLTIWSRVLSDKEILGLSNQVIELAPPQVQWWQKIGWPVALLLAVAIVSLLIWGPWRKKNHLRALDAGETGEGALADAGGLPDVDVTIPTSNYIRVFGPFEVIDKEGENITALFTPKLKRLFMLLLINSTRGKNGITGTEISDFLWGKDSKNAKSLRSVSILKLRKILERLDTVEVAFNVNKYALEMTGSVYCDYRQSLAMLEGKRVTDRPTFERFFDIVKRGEVFEGESFDWLDDAKSYMSNSAVDVMAQFIGSYQLDAEADTIIDIAGKMLVNDPCNEEALHFMTVAMMSRNNFKQARYVYDSFCTEYKRAYGEDFKMSFEEVASVEK